MADIDIGAGRVEQDLARASRRRVGAHEANRV